MNNDQSDGLDVVICFFPSYSFVIKAKKMNKLGTDHILIILSY